MANSFLANPWVLDTTGVITTGQIRVKAVRWVGATTAGHTAILKDKNANVVWASVASGANYVESDHVNEPPQGVNWEGLTLDTLASGKIYLELL